MQAARRTAAPPTQRPAQEADPTAGAGVQLGVPADCWYSILKCIPRHELRQGGCEPAEEQVARSKYLAILREARGRIDAGVKGLGS